MDQLLGRLRDGLAAGDPTAVSEALNLVDDQRPARRRAALELLDKKKLERPAAALQESSYLRYRRVKMNQVVGDQSEFKDAPTIYTESDEALHGTHKEQSPRAYSADPSQARYR